MGLLETLYLLLKTKKYRKGFVPIIIAAVLVGALIVSLLVQTACCKYYDNKWSRRFRNYLES
jgi:hypothetical protein